MRMARIGQAQLSYAMSNYLVACACASAYHYLMPNATPRPAPGQTYRRTSDGFLFVVVASRHGGAHLQAVDAARIMGWWDRAALARDFVAVAS